MNVYTETNIINPLYITTLNNGITLFVFDGYATGSDGKTYYHVGEDIDDELLTVGWSCEE